MVKKTKKPTNKEMNKEKKDIFEIWAENYSSFLKMWGDSHLKAYKPWIESMRELSDKMEHLSQDAMPEKYMEFYDEWMKTYQKTFGNMYPLPAQVSNNEILEKVLSSAEKSNKIYKSMIAELELNSKKTRELIRGEPDTAKYKECYNMWMNSYEKMFDELLVLPAFEGTKEILENYPGIPDFYTDTHKQISKLWKDSYSILYRPWIESMFDLSEKITQISKGKADPETYKEFYNTWMNTYKDNFGRLLEGQSIRSSQENIEHFLHSTHIYLDMYRSWMVALEKMTEKSTELSNLSDPEAYKEFCDLWMKMYQKAFESFFDDMPMVGPMKETMEPIKIAAQTYSDMYVEMSRMLSNFNPESRD